MVQPALKLIFAASCVCLFTLPCVVAADCRTADNQETACSEAAAKPPTVHSKKQRKVKKKIKKGSESKKGAYEISQKQVIVMTEEESKIMNEHNKLDGEHFRQRTTQRTMLKSASTYDKAVRNIDDYISGGLKKN